MIKKIINIWLDFLFPKKCLICQKDNNSYLCFNCFKKLQIKEPTCPNCGQKNQLGELCKHCQKNYIIKGVLVAGNLKDKNLANLIKFYKYNFIKDLAKPLSLFLINFLREQVIKNPIILLNNKSQQKLNLNDFSLIPVPLSNKRLKWRGFNQSQLLAKNIAKKFNLELLVDLKRIKHQKPQVKLNKKDRQSNLAGSFKWFGKNLKNKKIIIIDDVYTTGTTLKEIAKELKKHQASEIWGLVLAHG